MPQTVSYRFFASANEKVVVDLSFDDETYQLLPSADQPHPDWTLLSYRRCPNCTLPPEEIYCPPALGLARFLPSFESRVSYEKAVVEVETPNRIIVSKTALQHAIASLLGLVFATSGCPRSRFLRPLARFHLPFADERETMFRSLSAFLLGQFLANKVSGRDAALSLEELKRNYAELSIVNQELSERIRDAVQRDAALNAVIILDTFAFLAPDNIDGGYEDVLPCFAVEGE